ncbi:MAG TPA: hypothetical protein VEQ58_02955 [Polyangiaceae bacterium]|nr:hypothetical protein [Polyangiaceae bacterium]
MRAIRDCLGYAGELRLHPKPLYRAPGLRGLAAKLGLRLAPGESVRDAFCEPQLWEKYCAYTDCWTVAGAALLWKKLDKHSYDLSSLLVIEEPGASAAAYAIGSLELSEPEYACGCMSSSDFTTVSQPAPDTLVVEYQAEIRPGRMCSELYSKSTWLLDDQRRPLAAVLESGQPPSRITVTRSASELRVQNADRCEAAADWAELAAP